MPPTASVRLSNPSSNFNRAPKMSSNQSLNHLLNFTLPPRQPQINPPRRSSRQISSDTIYGIRSTERFVNAQYRFVMKPSGDYTVHFADPDIFFQWHDVLQVIIPRASAVAAAQSHEEDEGSINCPICLSPPTAPRMAKCGHVFCFPCILHYLSVSKVDKWIRCPICFDSVNEKQLKSVKWFDGYLSAREEQNSEPHEHEPALSPSSSKSPTVLRMRLMQRPQITTLSLPRSSTWPSELIPPHQAPFHFLPDVFPFSKFMLATPNYLIVDLTKDLDDLMEERRILAEMGDELGLMFIDAAEIRVRAEIQQAEAMNTESLERIVDKARRDMASIQQRQEQVQQVSLKSLETVSPRREIPDEINFLDAPAVVPNATSSRIVRPRRNVNPPPPSTSTYYYYQSAIGSPVFLHPLDIRILLSHFNSYAAFPNEITIRVEAFSEGTVDADLRKRCKYLALPEGADVVFVEADLESVVGAEGLKNFEGALKTRRAKRKERVRKDDRAKLRAEEREREEREKTYGASQWVDHLGFDTGARSEWLSSTSELESEAQLEPAQETQSEGAWGRRSFASALHSSPSQQPPRGRRHQDEIQDEWDVDVAWHEVEQRNGGRKKGRKQKVVVFGGGLGLARRH